MTAVLETCGDNEREIPWLTWLLRRGELGTVVRARGCDKRRSGRRRARRRRAPQGKCDAFAR